MRPLGRDGAEQRKGGRPRRLEERTGTKAGRSVLLHGASEEREENESQEYGPSGRRGKQAGDMGWGRHAERSCTDLEAPAGHLTMCSRAICIRHRDLVNIGFLAPAQTHSIRSLVGRPGNLHFK